MDTVKKKKKQKSFQQTVLAIFVLILLLHVPSNIHLLLLLSLLQLHCDRVGADRGGWELRGLGVSQGTVTARMLGIVIQQVVAFSVVFGWVCILLIVLLRRQVTPFALRSGATLWGGGTSVTVHLHPVLLLGCIDTLVVHL